MLGTKRFFSKNSAGIAALMAGGIVWLTGGMNALFLRRLSRPWVLLFVLGYPRFAEGELRRRMNGNKPQGKTSAKRSPVRAFRPCFALRRVRNQIKLIVAYLQPAVAESTSALDFPVLGTGARSLVCTWQPMGSSPAVRPVVESSG